MRVVGHDEVEGQVTSGQFCRTGTNYTLHFVAQFDRPFTAAGTWTSAGLAAAQSSCSGTSCGAYVTFDTTSQRQVLMKVGISFVSTSDAAQNLKAEDPGWSLADGGGAAHRQWNDILGRIAVGGGTPAEQHTFYTALYHSLLFPNVVSDVNGDYAGSDGRVHTDHGREEYANFSEWDIYRSEIQLESLLDPHAVGDMVQSLVDDAEQGGWLPKWAIVGGDESQMNGDSADPIIADAYAMGARNFDVKTALRYMVKGRDTDRDQSRARDRAPVPEPVPHPALRQRRLARPDLHRLLHRRFGHARIRPRRLLHRADRRRGARHLGGDHHGAARRELGVPLQPGHRVHPGPGQRRELPARPGLRGLPARAGRPDRLRGGERRAVHVVRSPRTWPRWRTSWAATPARWRSSTRSSAS